MDSKYITVRGVRVHNLKNIDLKIPRDKLVIFTGISGSGKSSLAFDTIYAVSYTHLDVYKRQQYDAVGSIAPACNSSPK